MYIYGEVVDRHYPLEHIFSIASAEEFPTKWAIFLRLGLLIQSPPFCRCVCIYIHTYIHTYMYIHRESNCMVAKIRR